MAALVPPVVPAILRHLRAYAEVAGADARDAASLVGRRLVQLLLGAVAALVSLLMICAWVLALAWDGPWRAWAAAGLAVAFGIVAVALALPVLRRRSDGKVRIFSRVRYEWSRDRELIERALAGEDRAAG